MTRHITFRASPAVTARIAELAEARGSTKAAAIRAAVVSAATPKHAPAVPTEAEVLELLGEAARGGSVAAMKELLVYHRERRGVAGAVDAVAELDELAARRRPYGPVRNGAR